MNSRDFVYWLHGFFELTPGGGEGLTKEQTELVRRHLDLVFKNEVALPTTGMLQPPMDYNRTGYDPYNAQPTLIC